MTVRVIEEKTVEAGFEVERLVGELPNRSGAWAEVMVLEADEMGELRDNPDDLSRAELVADENPPVD